MPDDPFAALAHPVRREILRLLRERDPRSAGEIAECFTGASRPGISRHVRILRESGLVSARHAGRQVTYSLDPRPLADIYTSFLAAFLPLADASLAELRRIVECDGATRAENR